MATKVAGGTIKFPVICEDAEINTEARQSPSPDLVLVTTYGCIS